MKIKSIFFAHKRYFALADRLKEERPEIELVMYDEDMKELPDTDAYFGFFPILNFYEKKYKWVHSIAAGVDKFLVQDMPKDTIFTRTIGQFGYQIGTYVLSYMLADVNLHAQYFSQQKEKLYKPTTKQVLKSKQVVIFGTGEIGKEIAKYLKAVEMEVIGISRSGNQVEYFDQVYPEKEALENLFDAEFIVNIMPLTEETKYYFNYEFFKHCKKAMFINVGRGKSVKEDDLKTALDQGFIRKAVLDVQEEEPLPSTSWMWEDERVLLTPHISGGPDLKQGARQIPEILRKIERQEPLDCLVDLDKKY